MSDQFQAVVQTAVVRGDDTIEVEIVTGSWASPKSAECRMKLQMPVEDARFYPAGAKVTVTLESEHEPVE